MKKTLAVLLTAVMVLGLAACGGSKETTATPAPAPAAAETEATAGPDEATEADFAGLWEYDDYYLWYQINGDGTWTLYNGRGEVYDETCAMDGNVLVLNDTDGSEYMRVWFENGVMIDDEGDTLFASELPDYYGYLGVWEYDEYYLWYEIHANGTYTMYSQDGVYEYEGERLEDLNFDVYDDGIALLAPNGEDILMALFPNTEDADKLLDSEDDTLFRSTLPEFETEE